MYSNLKTVNLDDFTCPCTGVNTINIDAQNGLTIEEVGLPSDFLGFFPCLAIKGKLRVVNDYWISSGEIRMQPGSEIVIEQNAELTISYTDNYGGIHGCQQMWQGVTVTDGAKLTFYRNIIKDAQYAITVEPNSTLGVMYRNTFENNHIGIYSPPAPQVYPVHITYPLRENIFIGTSNLLPPYDGELSNYQESRPYAGIEINTTKFTVGGGNPANVNYFKYIQNGIIANSSYLTVNNAKFIEIVSTPFLGGSAHGIILKNKSRGRIFNNYFTGHTRGIDINQSDANIRNNTMEIVFFCIYLEDENSHYINIANNNISFGKFGIVSLYSEYPNLFHIKYNKMYGLLETSIPFSWDAAIHIVGEQVTPFTNIVGYYTKKQIIDNEIELKDTYRGILLNGDGNWNISNNYKIKFTGPQDLNYLFSSGFAFLAGITCVASNNNYIYGNNVSSEEKTIFHNSNKQKSYYNLSSKNTKFCCNSSNNTLTGFEFSGTCSGTSIRHSSIGHHRFYGLCLKPATTLNNDQLHGENRWLDINAYPEGVAAIHFGNEEEIQNSRFYIQNVSSGSSDSDLWPPSWETPNSPNANWINPFPGSYQTCAEDVNNCSHPSNQIIEEEDINVTRSVYTGLYGDVLNWESSKALYSKLKNNSNLIGEHTEIDSFFMFSHNNAIASLYSIQEAFRTIYEPTTNQLSEIESTQSTMDNIWTQIEIIDSLYQFALTQSDSLALENQKRLLDQAFVQSAIDWANVMDDVKQQRLSSVGNVLALNQSITVTTMFESDEKVVNRVYLTTVASSIFTLDSLQFNLIKSIAEKCPLFDGDVVYRARNLYQLNESRIFGDAHCLPLSLQGTEGNQTYKIAEKKKDIPTALKIFPNPAKNEVTIQFPNNKKETIRSLQIKSLDGKIVKKISPIKSVYSIKIDISNLPKGIYFCEIQYSNGIENAGKFVKIN